MSMFTWYSRFWEFHIGVYIVTNVTNQLIFIVWDVSLLLLFREFHGISQHFTVDNASWILTDFTWFALVQFHSPTKVLISVENKVHVKVFQISFYLFSVLH